MADDLNSCIDPNEDIPELCKPCTARHHGICGALKPDELRILNKISTQKKIRAGTTIVADEQEYPFFASILEGVVKLSKSLQDGRQQIVGLQFAPDFLGRPFEAESKLTVEAANDLVLCTSPRKKFEDLLANSIGLQQRLLKQVLLELDESRDWLVSLGQKSANERVAAFLYMIARYSNPVLLSKDGADKTPIRFVLPLSRSDMGDFLGLTIETVSRQISKLRARGIISVVRSRHIEVHDIDRLASAAENEASFAKS